MQIIDDVNTTLENLLKKEYGADPGFDISYAMPDSTFVPISTTRSTANLYLYDIKENVELRSNEPIVERFADGSTIRKQPPMRVNLSYLITAWSPAADDPQGTQARQEHRLLSKLLWALVKYPTLPQDVLAGALIGQEPPPPTTVVLPDGLKNPAEFWSTFEGRPVKPGIDYSVTFSLDYHEAQQGRMVFAKISEYGSISSVYKLTIRPAIRLVNGGDHPKGTALVNMQIEAGLCRQLAVSAEQNQNAITLNDNTNIAVDDVLMIMDGEQTEFGKVTALLPHDQVQLEYPLFYAHKKGTEVRRLQQSAEQLNISLAAVAGPSSSYLRVSGQNIQQVKIGQIYKIDNPQKIEYCQVTEISGSEPALAAGADTFIQIGGLVTNSAAASITGAEVTLFDAALKSIKVELTDALGRFRFVDLGRGTYSFKVKAQGYSDINRTIADITKALFKDFIFEMQAS